MKRAIGYLRVSGLGQVDKDGEQRQKEAVLSFCAQNGLTCLDFKFEAGVSGTVEGLDRPAFREVLEMISKIDFDWQQEHTGSIYPDFGGVQAKQNRPCIVVERMDRLARDLMVQELLLRECRERGIEVYSADQPGLIDVASDLGDPSRKLFRQIMGALAEWEKSALVLKLRKARDRKRAATGRCEGILPYHETANGQVVIRKIESFRLDGVSVPETAARLNAEGLRTRNGKSWTKRSVLHVLQKAKGWKR